MDDPSALTRRRLLAGATAAAAGAAVPTLLRGAPGALAAPRRAVRFPAGIARGPQTYANWSRAIVIDGVPTATPRDGEDLVALARWAHATGRRLRARGHMHNWSPLTIAPGDRRSAVLLADTTRHLTGIRMVSSSPAAVRVQAGASMESLLTFLHARGLGLTATPAPGDITVAGALAIDGHGTAVPARGETRRPGHTFGSLSNLVLAMTVVAWSPRRRRYELRRIDRADPASGAFLTHLGRGLVVDVTLRAGADAPLRCQSFTDIPASELFAAPGTPGATRTFASFLDESGRAEAIWFPFTEAPWMKVWTVAPTQPAGTRATSGPFNYPFAEGLSLDTAMQLDRSTIANPSSTPALGRLSMQTVASGLAQDGRADLWGPSKDLLLYVRPETLRVTANGYAIHTRRRDVQEVISRFAAYYSERMAALRAKGEYPANGPLEVRVTGLDHPRDVGVRGASTPTLSAVSPDPRHPEWDTAVWLDILTFPDTPGAASFLREVERWIFATFRAPLAGVRPEWSKGWAYSAQAAWADRTMLRRTVPAAYRAGRPRAAGWDGARATLHAADPHGVFSNAFLDRLLG